MGILDKSYGILTNPAYLDGLEEGAASEPAPLPAADPAPQPLPTVRPAPPQQAPLPVFRPNPLRQQQEQGLQRGVMAMESKPAPTGFWGKAGHILSNIGNAAGNVILGANNMAMIPGTQLHDVAEHNAALSELGQLQKQDEGEQQAFDREQEGQSENALRAASANKITAETKTPEQIQADLDHVTAETDALKRPDLAHAYATAVTSAMQNGSDPSQDPVVQHIADAIQAIQKPVNVSAKEQVQRQLLAAEQSGDKGAVSKLQQQLKDMDPMGQQRLAITVQGQNLANQRAEQTADRQAIREHDKAYVEPAETVEKSYNMMDHAYQEYENARKQGKVLPTGAQSMLALSTHLATTFGNVKGARVTRDMIQHHLGARSVSDSALVAIQKLTNGDALSPGQWDAFHDLIKQSRNLSWSTAVKEAARKKVPIDFLPPDLETIQKNGVTYTMGQDGQYHKEGSDAR